MPGGATSCWEVSSLGCGADAKPLGDQAAVQLGKELLRSFADAASPAAAGDASAGGAAARARGAAHASPAAASASASATSLVSNASDAAAAAPAHEKPDHRRRQP